MFHEDVEKILKENGWQGVLSPWELLDTWKQFVAECKSGYEMSIYEYDNDLSVRDKIEEIISAKQVKGYQEYYDFSKKVDFIDNLFKKLLSPNVKRDNKYTWWQQGILVKAGEEYARDINDLFHFQINII